MDGSSSFFSSLPSGCAELLVVHIFLDARCLMTWSRGRQITAENKMPLAMVFCCLVPPQIPAIITSILCNRNEAALLGLFLFQARTECLLHSARSDEFTQEYTAMPVAQLGRDDSMILNFLQHGQTLFAL
jgi:hypothetical protein